MAPLQRQIAKVSPPAHLARERVAEFKHEYEVGVVTAMAGASKEHVSMKLT